MRKAAVTTIIGMLLLFLGFVMCVPLAVAYWYESHDEIPAFVESIAITFVSGLIIFAVARSLRSDRELRIRDACAVVALGWAVVSLFGALPFWLAGDLGIPSFIDALFESTSGFTTTGASILLPEELPRGLLFWRSFTHWFGGMGIVVLAVAILPFLGGGGYQLLQVESPGPTTDKLRPRIADTAKFLWIAYFVLTATLVLLLLPKMDLFDATCHAFGTVATGGFSTKNASIGAFDSVYVEAVITVFMFICGVNFALHFRMLRGEGIHHHRDTEFRFYAGLLITGIVAVSVLLWLGSYPDRFEDSQTYEGLGHCLRAATFQVVSIATTTGYGTADFDGWPNVCRLLLMFFMVIGACSGSTGGGTKCIRLLIVLKYGLREIIQLIRPHAVLTMRIGEQVVDRKTIGRVMGFLALWLALFLVSVVFMMLILDAVEPPLVTDTGEPSLSAELKHERSFETAFGTVLATMGNIGPGIADVGPASNFADIPTVGKGLLIFLMIVGRLEIYCVLVLFLPLTWKR